MNILTYYTFIIAMILLQVGLCLQVHFWKNCMTTEVNENSREAAEHVCWRHTVCVFERAKIIND